MDYDSNVAGERSWADASNFFGSVIGGVYLFRLICE